MKENTSLINPYDVLEVPRAASTAEITKAMAVAMKRKQYPVDIIAKAQKTLINPKKRLLADYLSPILPTIQRFKRQDYSGLEQPVPSLDFLPQFDTLNSENQQEQSISPSDQHLGRTLFSTCTVLSAAPFTESERDDDVAPLAELKSYSDNSSSLALDPLEGATSDFVVSPSELKTKAKVFTIEHVKDNPILQASAVALFLLLFTSTAVVLGTLSSRSSSTTRRSPSVEATQAPSTATLSTPQPIATSPTARLSPEVDTSAQDVSDRKLSSQSTGQQEQSNYTFPSDTCGARDPGGTNTWYPVYINYSEKNLSNVQNEYCRDAILEYREDIDLHSIQVASFLNLADAQKFASLMRAELGSGEVGEANTYNFDPPAQSSSSTPREETRYIFPLRTCGDEDPGGTNTWYPVYVNYSERNLSMIQTKYCRDAIRKYREKLGLHSIQIASFLSRSDALNFADLMRDEIGSGEVGEPNRYNFDGN